MKGRILLVMLLLGSSSCADGTSGTPDTSTVDDSSSSDTKDSTGEVPCRPNGMPCDPADPKKWRTDLCCSHGCDQSLGTMLTECR